MNEAVPFLIKNLTPGSIPAWATLVLAIVSMGIWLYPKMRKANLDESALALKARGVMDERHESEMKACTAECDKLRERMSKLEEKIEAAQAKAQAAENKLVAAVSAITLLCAEVRRLDPDAQSPVLAQVQELIAAATSGDFGVVAGLRRVAGAVAQGRVS